MSDASIYFKQLNKDRGYSATYKWVKSSNSLNLLNMYQWALHVTIIFIYENR